MSTTCESAVRGPNKGSLGEIEGESIVEVKILNGGHKYCDSIEMKLTGGKFLQFCKHLDMSSYGINPRIEYKIGAWFKCFTNELNENDCIGQQLFNFLHKS